MANLVCFGVTGKLANYFPRVGSSSLVKGATPGTVGDVSFLGSSIISHFKVFKQGFRFRISEIH